MKSPESGSIDHPISVDRLGRKRGRRSKFDPSLLKVIEAMFRMGAIDTEVADSLNISVRTLYRWYASRPEFCQAIKKAKAVADDRIERALYQRGLGYHVEVEKVVAIKVKIGEHEEGLKLARTTESQHVAPDMKALIFWLRNRRPEKWA